MNYQSNGLEIRHAIPSDIIDIKKILSFYCLYIDKIEKNLSMFMIAVLPSYRNRGIGSALVDILLEHAAELTDTVYLRTTSPVFFEKKGAQTTCSYNSP